MKRLFALLAVASLAASASPARAAILYTQPFDGTGNGYASQNDTNGGGFGNFATVYDDFRLTQTSLVTNVRWTGEYFNPPAPGPITGYTLRFWADNAGQPGSLLQTQTVSGNANQTFLGNFGGFPVYTYDANLTTAFQAQAGVRYWLSIVPDLGFPPQWGWSTATGGNGVSYQDFFGSRSQQPADLAFTLSGNAVPEPATLCVFGFVAAAGGLCARRRKTGVGA